MIEDALPDDDPLDDQPHDEPSKGFVPDFVRRLAWAGLGAVFMSEEGIRRLGSQLKLPKEALSYLLAQAEKTKDEVGRVVSEEVRKLLQSERLRDELVKLVSQMTIEVKAEVRLVPDRVRDEPGVVEPRVKVSELRTKYTSRKKAGGEPSTS
jgi:regulator of replication initiation timing